MGQKGERERLRQRLWRDEEDGKMREGRGNRRIRSARRSEAIEFEKQ